MSSGLTSQLDSVIQSDDASGLEDYLNTASVTTADFSSLLYESIVQRSYQCLETILKYDQCDPYLPITGDEICLPPLHHAIRLGDLHACKLLLDARVHPLACTGHCVDTSGSIESCEDAVRYALHGATESNRRNAIAVLLQTHLYSLISALVTACETGNHDQLERLLPSGLRLQCSLNVLANCQPRSRPPESSTTMRPASDGLPSSDNSSSEWSSSLVSISGAFNLGSSGMELGKRVLGFTSERALSAVSSFSNFLFNLNNNSTEKTQPFVNFLSEAELIGWTRSCLGALLLICVQRGHQRCLSLLLKSGFRVDRVSRPLGADCVDQQAHNKPDRFLFHTLQVEQTIQPTGSGRLPPRPWTEAPESDVDSAIHAAVRFNRVSFLKTIIQYDPDALSLSIPENGIGSLPLHTAAFHGRTECLSILLHQPIDSGETSVRPEASYPSYSCRVDGQPATYRFPFCMDQLDIYGLTPFLLAVLAGHVSVVRMLLQFELPTQPALSSSPNGSFSIAEEPVLDFEETWLSDSGCSAEVDPASIPSKSIAPTVSGQTASINPQGSRQWVKLHPRWALTVSPISLNRRIQACWYPGRWVKNQLGISEPQRSRLIVNPSSCESQSEPVVCGQFNALHLSVISGNVELVELVLDHLLREVNVPAGPCTHLPRTDATHPSEILTTSPLGLACRLADLDEKMACQLAELLMASGAFDPEQTLFYHAFKRHQLDLAGLLLTCQASRTLTSSNQNEAGIHVNLSHKRLDRKYIPNALWLLRHGPLTDWLHNSCNWSQPDRRLVQTGAVHHVTRAMRHSFADCPITRVSLSHCGLQLFPWCVVGDLPNLKELDVSWNHLGEFTLDPPRLINHPSYRSCPADPWAPNLICLDLSHNHISHLPTWLFVNRTEESPTVFFAHRPSRLSVTHKLFHIRSRSMSPESSMRSFQFAPRLTHLMLSHNRLHALPGAIWASPSLQFLDLSWNLLTTLPWPDQAQVRTIGIGLRSTRSCSVPSLLCSVPDQTALTAVSRITSDSSVSVSHSENHLPSRSERTSVQLVPVGDLWDTVDELASPSDNLATEDHTRYSKHLDWYQSQSTLTQLWIQHNCITSLVPRSLEQEASGDQRAVSGIPKPTLAQLAPKLKYLDASHNRIRTMPGYEQFPHTLIHLDLSGNCLTIWGDLPISHSSTESRTVEVDRSKERPRSVSKHAAGLPHPARCASSHPRSNDSVGANVDKLTEYLQSNTTLATLPRLEHLNLRGNRLEWFCPRLYRQRVDPVQISDRPIGPYQFSLSAEPTRLPALRTLDLGNNPGLKSLAHGVCDLVKMEQLLLDGCTALTQLPAELWRLPNLYAIYLDRTPFDFGLQPVPRNKPKRLITKSTEHAHRSSPTAEAVPSPTRQLLDEFREAAETARPFTHFNLVILGSPESGKSTLVRLLHAVDQPDNVFRATQHDRSKVTHAMDPKMSPPFKSGGLNPSKRSRASAQSEHANVPVNTSSNTGPVPAVRISLLTVRPPVANQESSTSDPAETPVSFRVWDVEGSHAMVQHPKQHASAAPQMRVSTSTLGCLQQITYFRASVFLVLWRMSDGVDGLNRVTRWLMDIQAHAPGSPIILVGTHADHCRTVDSSPWSAIRLNRSSHSGDRCSSNNLEILNDLVRSRFSGQLDLTAFGLPNLFGHVMLNLMADTNTDLRQAVHGLLAMVYRAAHAVVVSSRIKSTMLLSTSASSGPSCPLIRLRVPDLYHRAVQCVYQISTELMHAALPPILLVDQFLLELDQRLRRLDNPSPIQFERNYTSDEIRSSEDTNTVAGNSTHPVYLLPRSRGFESREEARALLAFLRQFGLVWHVDDPRLRHLVFLSPVWLFQWLFGLLIELSRRHPPSTAFVRRDRARTGSFSGPIRGTQSSSVIVTQSELHRLARAQLDELKQSNRSDLRTNRLNLILWSLVPVMTKLQLAIRLDCSRILLPTLLSARRVHTRTVKPVVPSPGLIPASIVRTPVPAPEVTTEINRTRGADPVHVCELHNNARVIDGLASVNRTAPWGPLDVRTIPGEEIVRLYVTTYVPTDFWTRLFSRLLTDTTLDEICNRIYPLGKLKAAAVQSTDSIDANSYEQLTEHSAEWTLWKHGMRLSIAGGQIGLARLQQFTRGPCAIHRPPWTDRCLGETTQQFRVRDNLQLFVDSDEWEEVAASEGEELNPESGLHDPDSSPLVNRRSASSLASPGLHTYRSGVVGAMRNTYQRRKVHLLRWATAQPNVVENRTTESQSHKGSQQQESKQPTTPRTASTFTFHQSGELVHDEYDGFQTSCLIEIYIPCHSLVWPTASTYQPGALCPERAESVPNLQHSPNGTDSGSAASPITKQYIKPNAEFTAKLLVKLVDHIDRLLEDWYPDLGTRLRQSNDGTYLVDRLIPCCVCLASSPSVNPAAKNEAANRVKGSKRHFAKSHSSEDVSKPVLMWDALAKVSVTESSNRDGRFDGFAPQPSQDPTALRRCISSSQSNLVDENQLVVSLSSGDHHISAQPTSRAFRVGQTRCRWPKHLFRRKHLRRSHSVEVLGGDSSTTPSTPILYGISVREYLHWLTMHRPSDNFSAAQPNRTESHHTPRLYCPVHTSVPFQAPDLHFEDLNRLLRFGASSVHLSEFLGRGAFGSVFAGTLTVHPDSLVPGCGPIPIAVKLSTPVHPKLFDVQTEVTDQNCTMISSDDPIREALVLYRQEQRRWMQAPMEACYTAYHEARAELNVLVQIGVGLSLRKFHANKLRRTHSNHTSMSMMTRIPKRSIHHRLRPDTNQGVSPIHRQHLLTCLGLIAPNPLGVLIPLAPAGNMAQYLARLREAFLQIENSPTIEETISRPKHPIHPITMTLIIHQMASALAHLHGMHIVHRDVKLDNLLIWTIPPPILDAVSSNRLDPRAVSIVLTDYGASQLQCPSEGCRGYVGTPGYMAPEILRFLGEESYTEKVDVYSMGIIMCELVKLEPAYKQCASTRFHLAQQVLSGRRPKIPESLALGCPTHILDLLSLCWSNDPDLRPTAATVAELTSPWWSINDPGILTPSQPTNQHAGRTKSIQTDQRTMEPNGLCHIRTAHRVRSMDVVTCVVLDKHNALWLGGYRKRHSVTEASKSRVLSSSTSNTTVSSREGLLVRTTLHGSGPSRSLLVDRWYPQWPLGWSNLQVNLQPSHSESVEDRFEWPAQLCSVSLSDPDDDQHDILMHCLTSKGDLTVYSGCAQPVCLLRTRLTQHHTTARSGNQASRTASGLGNFLLLSLQSGLSCSSVNDSNSRVSHYRIVCVLPQGQLGLLEFERTRAGVARDRVRLLHSTWISSMDRLNVIHCGLVVPCTVGPNLIGSNLEVWFGQSRGLLTCYDADLVTQQSSLVIRSRSRKATSTLRHRLTWPASHSPNNESVVTALALGEPTGFDGRQTKLSTVWSCLCPDRVLICWSVTSRAALQTISFDASSPIVQLTASDHPSFNYTTCMHWLGPSHLLMLNSRGYLVHIGLIKMPHTYTMRCQQLFRLHHKHCPTETTFHLIVRHVHGTPQHIYTLGPGYAHPLCRLLHSRQVNVTDCPRSPHIVQLFYDEYLFPINASDC